MRKLLLIITSAFIISTSSFARTRIYLSVTAPIDPRPIGNGHPKSPIQPPTVYIEDYTLNFSAFEEDCTIQLLDDSGVVYSDVIPAGTTSYSLPGTLSGEYTIQLLLGNWIFEGEIGL